LTHTVQLVYFNTTFNVHKQTICEKRHINAVSNNWR